MCFVCKMRAALKSQGVTDEQALPMMVIAVDALEKFTAALGNVADKVREFPMLFSRPELYDLNEACTLLLNSEEDAEANAKKTEQTMKELQAKYEAAMNAMFNGPNGGKLH